MIGPSNVNNVIIDANTHITVLPFKGAVSFFMKFILHWSGNGGKPFN